MSDVTPDVTPEEQAAAEKSADERTGPEAPPATFNTLILSMGTNALVQLGEAPTEIVGNDPPPRNLALAKHSIDMLALIEEKTSGNLTGEEERLLSQLLYDLRMRYVAARKS